VSIIVESAMSAEFRHAPSQVVVFKCLQGDVEPLYIFERLPIDSEVGAPHVGMLGNSIDLGDDRIDHWVGTVHHSTGEPADAGEVDWSVDQRGLRIAAKGSDDALYPICWVNAVGIGTHDDIAACLLEGALASSGDSFSRLVHELEVQALLFSHLDGDMRCVIGTSVEADDGFDIGRGLLPGDGAQAIPDAILLVVGRNSNGNQYSIGGVQCFVGVVCRSKQAFSSSGSFPFLVIEGKI